MFRTDNSYLLLFHFNFIDCKKNHTKIVKLFTRKDNSCPKMFRTDNCHKMIYLLTNFITKFFNSSIVWFCLSIFSFCFSFCFIIILIDSFDNSWFVITIFSG